MNQTSLLQFSEKVDQMVETQGLVLAQGEASHISPHVRQSEYRLQSAARLRTRLVLLLICPLMHLLHCATPSLKTLITPS